MDGKPAEGIFRINSLYPPDGFWWDSQLRITPAFPAGVHFLEPYAHAVAELDACRVTRGGLFLDKAHTEEIRRFALPIARCRGRSLRPWARRLIPSPSARWFTADALLLPGQPRLLSGGGARGLRPPGAALRSLLARTNRRGTRMVLDARRLPVRSLTLSPDTAATGFRATPPSDVLAACHADARKALANLDAAAARGLFIPGAEQIRRGIEKALAEGRLAYLRRALTSYAVRKARV